MPRHCQSHGPNLPQGCVPAHNGYATQLFRSRNEVLALSTSFGRLANL